MKTQSGTIHKCSICFKEFKDASKLNRHLRVHSHAVVKPYKCSLCGKCFPQPSHLEQHLRTHTGVRPYSCHNCGKDFSVKQNLTRHLLTHAGEKPFHCNVCGKDFVQKYNLDLHMLKHHGEKQLICPFCSRRFALKNDLDMHVSQHTGEKVHPGDPTDFNATCKSFLKTLLMKGSYIRPYKCSSCEKSFTQKSHLRDHERTHTGEKPFSCTKCGKDFSQKQNLTVHMKRMHTEEEPLNLCSRPFGSRDYMELHLSHRRVEEINQCQSCELIYAWKGTLNDYLQTHKESRLFKCKLCEDTFKCTKYFKVDEKVQNTGENYFELDKISPIDLNAKLVLPTDKSEETVRNHLVSLNIEIFECEIGSKTEKPEKCSLSKNLKTYSVEKPLKCQFGSYHTDFGDSRRHNERKHKEVGNLQCRSCSFSSNKKTMVTLHQIKEHPQV